VHQNCTPNTTDLEERIANNENPEKNISLWTTQFEVVHQNCTSITTNHKESIANKENPEENNSSLMDILFNKR